MAGGGFWSILSFCFSALLAGLVFYQTIYIIIGLFVKKKYKETNNEHSYGILIAGRNEEAVIGQLLDSIKKQNYDKSKIKIFVLS